MMTEPLLLRVARLCVGLTEYPGSASNPVILQWARDIGAPSWYTHDGQSWCAVAANRWALACGYPMAGTGFELIRARSFEHWGQAVSKPILGAILVFQRTGGAHVGLYLGERAGEFRVLGGNQGNAVREDWWPKRKLTAMRWPAGVDLPTSGPVLITATAETVTETT